MIDRLLIALLDKLVMAAIAAIAAYFRARARRMEREKRNAEIRKQTEEAKSSEDLDRAAERVSGNLGS